MTISDHYLIYRIRKFKTFKQAPKFIEYRNFKNYSDPNKSWISWKNKFLETVNMHAPLKRRKVSNRQIPWLTNDLFLKGREKYI